MLRIAISIAVDCDSSKAELFRSSKKDKSKTLEKSMEKLRFIENEGKAHRITRHAISPLLLIRRVRKGPKDDIAFSRIAQKGIGLRPAGDRPASAPGVLYCGLMIWKLPNREWKNSARVEDAHVL